jgi:hypothetical protein
MDEIISTGKILRSHCQPRVGVSDGKYRNRRAGVPDRNGGTETGEWTKSHTIIYE